MATAAASVAADPIADALKTILSQVDAIASTASVSSKASAQAASAAVNNLVRQFNAYNAMLQAQQAKRSLNNQDPTRYRSTQASLFGRQKVRGSSGSYTNLYQVGVRQDGDGTLTVNQDALGSAAKADPRSVLALVGGDGSSGSGLAHDLQANVSGYILSLGAAAGAGATLLSATQLATSNQPAAALTELYRTVAQVG